MSVFFLWLAIRETLGQEHSGIVSVRFDKDSVRRYLRECRLDSIIDNGLAALILAGWSEFGDDYGLTLINELNKPPLNSEIKLENPFIYK